MKVGRLAKAALFLASLFLSFSIFSCSNFSDGVSSVIPFLQQDKGGSSSGGTQAAKKTVVFRGTIGGGAYPAQIAAALSGASASFDGVSKSAYPTTSGPNFKLFAYAEAKSGDVVTDTSVGAFGTGTAANFFEISLAVGKTWTVYCGLKDTKGTDDESDDVEVLSDFHTEDITEASPVLSHTFYPAPKTTGSGSMALSVTMEGEAKNVLAAWQEEALSSSCPITVDPSASSGGTKTVSADGIPCGSHELLLEFVDENGAVLYANFQQIVVFDGMETDSWTADGSGAISGGVFLVYDNLVKTALSSTIYVGKPAALADVQAAKDADDNNLGNAYSPFATVQKALDKIAAYGNGGSYRIYVSGSVAGSKDSSGLAGGAQIIPTVAAKSSAIWIVGLDALGLDGAPASAIDAGGADSALMVVASVPVTIKNVALKNAKTGLSIAGSGSEVKLASGSLVTQNKRGVSVSSGTLTLDGGTISGNVTVPDSISYGNGAGVNVSGGGTFLMKSGTISGNTAVRDGENSATGLGGGVYVLGTFKMTGGTISNNKAASGGGVCVANSASGAISGGTITENEATAQGGGVSVSAYTSITGGTISKNKAPANMGGAISTTRTYLTLGGFVYIPRGDGTTASPLNDVAIVGTDFISHATYMNLSGDLSKHSSSVKVGLSIPDGMWKRWQEIIKTPDGMTLPDNIEQKFALTPPNSVDGWAAERSGDKKAVRLFAPIYVAADAAYNATTNPQGYRVCKTAGDNSNPGTKSKPYASLSTAVFNLKDAGKDLAIYIDGTVKGCTTVSGLSNDASNSSAWGYAKSLTISGASTFTTTATTGDQLDCLDGGLSDAEPGIGASGNTLYIMPMPVPITITSLKVTGGKSASDGGGICLNSVASGGATVTLAKDARVEGNRAVGNGAGVYVAEKATLNVLSNAYVYDNYNITVDADNPSGVDKGPSNVYLPAGKKINVIGALTATGGANGAKAKIGVTGEDAIAPGTTVVFTNGYGFGAGGNNAGVYPSAYFTGDKYTVALDPAAGGTESVLGVSGGSLIVEPFYEDITISVDKTQFLKSASKKEMTFSAKATAADGTETDVPIGSGTGEIPLNFEMTFHGETVPSTYHRLVEETANKLELVGDLPVGDYILTAVWIYNGKEYRSSFGVSIISELFTSKPKSLPAGTDGSVGTSGEYVYFGDWPQTLKDPSVTVDESNSMVSGAFTYYMGSDDCWYAKCKENAYESGYKYNDGTTPVAQDSANSYKFFKVEPIKWRVVTTDYESSGKALLVAEKILYSSVQYYDENGDMHVNKNRTIDGVTVYPNNYKHSKIRAYLNGINYNKSGSNCADYKDLGFLQSAFSASAQSLIKTTTVKNDLNSTKSYDNSVTYSDYICDNTSDKVFLLSLAELVNGDWFEHVKTSAKRIRGYSDFALANNLYLYSGGGYWWSRTPRNPSYGTHYGYSVKQDGDVLGSSPDIERKYFGIVPAICIDAP